MHKGKVAFIGILLSVFVIGQAGTVNSAAQTKQAGVAVKSGYIVKEGEEIKTVADTAAYHPGRVLIKFKEGSTLANTLFRAGNLSPYLLETGDFKGKYKKDKIKSIKPLFKALGKNNLGQKRKSVEQAQLVAQKFPKRSKRNAQKDNSHLENIYVFEFDENNDATNVLEDLRASEQVEFVELDAEVNVNFTPNDPSFGSLWGLSAGHMALEQAWDVAQGDGIIVAVVDTGVDYNHEDLLDNIWVNIKEVPGNGIDDDGNGFVDDIHGYDFVNYDGDPIDDYGHGTHVAGTVAAVGNNGKGIVGVAPAAKVMVLKGLSATGGGYASDLANCLVYAANMGADVINNSWGSSSELSAVSDAINYAYSLGSFIVAAAGNSNSYNTFYPAGYPNVLSVAALDNNKKRASFSNYGLSIDVAAPGVQILSTMPQYPVTMTRQYGYSQGYANLQGTSMASPHVAGEAALILSMHPEYTLDQLTNAIKIAANAQLTSEEYIGTGLVNAAQAVKLSSPSTAVAQISSPAYIDPANGLVSITGSATGSSFELKYGPSPYGQQWSSFHSGTDVSNGALGILDVDSAPGGDLFVKLEVQGGSGQVLSHMTKVYIDHDLMPGWPQQLLTKGGQPNFIGSSPLVADFDGDGQNEILGACYYPYCQMRLWELDGTTVPGWPLQLSGPLLSTPATMDLDKNGDLEIIFVRGYPTFYLYIYNHDGTPFKAPVPITVSGTSTGMVTSPTVGDINGDGIDEFMFAYAEQSQINVIAMDINGKMLPGWPYKFTGVNNMRLAEGLALADIDQNGMNDLVVSFDEVGATTEEYKLYIYALNGDGVVLPGWPRVKMGEWNPQKPAIGDLDRDGDLEIVLVTGSGIVHVLGYDGTEAPGWPQDNRGSIMSGVTISDLDRDGDLELIWADINGYITVFHHDGVLASGWPVNMNEGLVVLGRFFTSSPVVGDIDHDGKPDIVLGAPNVSKVYAFDNVGKIMTGFPKRVDSDGPFPGVEATATIGDFNSNGKTDMLIGSGGGKVYLWELADTINDAALPWPRFGQNLKNQSYLEIKELLNFIGNKTALVGNELSFTVSGYKDMGQLIFSTGSLPDGATFDSLSKMFKWAPSSGQMGTHKVLFKVTDGITNDSEEITIAVGTSNALPILTPIGDKTITENKILTFKVTATDTDPYDTLKFSATGLPLGAGFYGSTQTFAWTPLVGQAGTYVVHFEVSDGKAVDSEDVTLEILKEGVISENHPPILTPIGNKTIMENQYLSFKVTATDADPYDTLGYSVMSMPVWSSFDPSTQTFSGTPPVGMAATYVVHFSVCDGKAVDSEDVTITVQKLNKPPVLSPIGSKTVMENQNLTFKVTATDADPNDTLSFSATGVPTWAFFYPSTQTFIGTPPVGQAGTYVVRMEVHDGKDIDYEDVTITVQKADQPPVLAPIGNKTVINGQLLRFTVTASDPDGDPYIFMFSALPPGATFDTKTGEFNWIGALPKGKTSVSYTVTFKVSDGQYLDEETITITVVKSTTSGGSTGGGGKKR